MSYRALNLQVISSTGLVIAEALHADDAVRIAMALNIVRGLTLSQLGEFLSEEDSLSTYISTSKDSDSATTVGDTPDPSMACPSNE